MIASWMIYVFLVTLGVTVAAAALEGGLRANRLPARMVWAGAIYLIIIAAVWSAPRTRKQKLAVTPIEMSRDVARPDRRAVRGQRYWIPGQFTVAVSPDSASSKFDSTLVAIWLAASLLTLGAFGGGARRLHRIRSMAKIHNIDGLDVAVTPEAGPLVAGIFHPQIILPDWVLELERSEQQLVIAHEQEHVRGRDPALLAVGALAVIMAPWNLPLWYMLRRLRVAVELDCDRRVLGVHPDARAYAGLLLSVASRSQTSPLPVAGLSASVPSLEQRFRFMTTNPHSQMSYRLIASVALVALLIVATAMIPRPVRGVNSTTLATQPGARATGRVKVTSASGLATYRVYTTGGTFVELGKSPLARTDTLTETVSASSAGNVFDIDVTNGDVHFVARNPSTIHVEAAMSGQSPAVWLSATSEHIVIQQGGAGVLTQGPTQAADAATTTFFEYQVDKPVTPHANINPRYPAALKSSGVRGDVLVQFVVDEAGRVDMGTFESLRSSGPAFTAAVKETLPIWRFDPAIRQGKRVKQVVQQAFEFKPAS
jgi:TonB family protein